MFAKLDPPTDATWAGTPAFARPRRSAATPRTRRWLVTNAAGIWRDRFVCRRPKNEAASSAVRPAGHGHQGRALARNPPSPSSGEFGATLNDSATLTNAISPTGSIVISLFDPDDATCAGARRHRDGGAQWQHGQHVHRVREQQVRHLARPPRTRVTRTTTPPRAAVRPSRSRSTRHRRRSRRRSATTRRLGDAVRINRQRHLRRSVQYAAATRSTARRRSSCSRRRSHCRLVPRRRPTTWTSRE